jgi:hypothetical protein
MSKKKATEAAVFIIESMSTKNEAEKKFEGFILQSVLNLLKNEDTKIESRYYYIRTKLELEHIIEEFHKSKYRYLHLSCHGSEDGKEIQLTYETIALDEFCRLLTLSGTMESKRLFMSSCFVTNEYFANILIPRTNCSSIIGTDKAFFIDEAPLIWGTFYNKMFTMGEGMQKGYITPILNKISKLFDCNMTFFYRNTKQIGTIKEVVNGFDKKNPRRKRN